MTAELVIDCFAGGGGASLGIEMALGRSPDVAIIRRRLFMVAQRRDGGRRIAWPKVTHGDPKLPAVKRGGLLPWRTAADCIDWSLPCPSIFDTAAEIWAKHGLRAKRPLADATLRRIARGIVRYVLENPRPFVMMMRNSQKPWNGADEPFHTVTAGGANPALIAPVLVPRYGARPGQEPRCLPIDAPGPVVVPTGNGAGLVAATLTSYYGPGEGGQDRSRSLGDPLATDTAGGNRHGLVAAFLAQHNTGMVGHDLRKPISTIIAGGIGLPTQALVAAHLADLHGSNVAGASIEDPARTVSAGGQHAGLVAAFLTKYYGTDQDPRLAEPMHTDTTRDRFGLVTVTIDGLAYALVEIGMRMLTPRERFRAQGFPDSYEIETGLGPDGEDVPLTAEQQGRCCGNSVCPPLAAALVAANCPDMVARQAVVAAE